MDPKVRVKKLDTQLIDLREVGTIYLKEVTFYIHQACSQEANEKKMLNDYRHFCSRKCGPVRTP